MADAILAPACLVLIAASLAGCSAGGPPLGEVRGLVTFNGRPAHAELIFEPESSHGVGGGRVSTAYTRPDGTYRIQYTEHRTGAVIGPHHVTIRILRPETDDPQRTFDEATIPLKTVRLKRTVSPGRNELHFPTVL
jgi:hypothetical protein